MDRMIDPTIEYRGLDSYLSDPEIWEQAFWGTIGSLVFTGLGAAYRTGQREKFIKEHKENLCALLAFSFLIFYLIPV